MVCTNLLDLKATVLVEQQKQTKSMSWHSVNLSHISSLDWECTVPMKKRSIWGKSGRVLEDQQQVLLVVLFDEIVLTLLRSKI